MLLVLVKLPLLLKTGCAPAVLSSKNRASFCATKLPVLLNTLPPWTVIRPAPVQVVLPALLIVLPEASALSAPPRLSGTVAGRVQLPTRVPPFQLTVPAPEKVLDRKSTRLNSSHL